MFESLKALEIDLISLDLRTHLKKDDSNININWVPDCGRLISSGVASHIRCQYNVSHIFLSFSFTFAHLGAKIWP